MLWIVGIIILILVVVSASLRTFVPLLVAVAVIGCFLGNQYEEREDTLSKQRIPVAELTFDDVGLRSSFVSYYDLVGRITNNSKLYTLNEVQLNLTFRDCPGDDERQCVLIARTTAYIYTSIPPNEARGFTAGIHLYPDLRVKGHLVWQYQVVYTKADRV